MAKQNNPQMKKYLVKFVIDIFRKCKLLVDEYGEDFAQDRLRINLRKVFTNDVSEFGGGYYRPKDHSIGLCISGPDGKLLRQEDLSKNDREIILHELIHAIFNKTKKECKKEGIKSGTGMLLDFYKSPELGRGLNEGLTQWICEKAADSKNIDYLTLKGFIKQIELAIGERNVIKLARGITNVNDRDSMANLLHMSQSEVIKYLSLADAFYLSEEREKKFDIIIDTLGRDVIRDSLSKEEKEELDEDLEIIEYDEFYKGLIDQEEYNKYLHDNNLEDSKENRLKFAYKMVEKNQKESEKLRVNFESMTFEHFFKKEFESLIGSEVISDEAFIKFYKLSELMQWPGDHYPDSILNRFFEEFEAIQKKYFESNGVEISDDTHCLMGDLAVRGELNDINRYEIINYNNPCQWGRRRLYLKDGKLSSVGEWKDMVSCLGRDEESYRNAFGDFLSDEYGDTMRENILRFRSQLVMEDPDVTFNVLGLDIVTVSKGKISFYTLKNGEIIPVEETGRRTIKPFIDQPKVNKRQEKVDVNQPKESIQQVDKPEKNVQLAKPKRKTFIQRMFNSIQRLLFPNSTDGVSYVTTVKEAQQSTRSYLDSLKVEVSENEQGFQNNRNERNQPSEDEINQSNSDDKYI